MTSPADKAKEGNTPAEISSADADAGCSPGDPTLGPGSSQDGGLEPGARRGSRDAPLASFPCLGLEMTSDPKGGGYCAGDGDADSAVYCFRYKPGTCPEGLGASHWRNLKLQLQQYYQGASTVQ